MNIKQKFNSIDQSKLDSKQVEILKNIEQKTDGFKTKDKEIISKIDTALDKIISALKDKNPEAIKTKKTSKIKSQKSSGGGKRTLFSIAKDIRKSDETWEEAKNRAKKIMEDENKQTTQKMKSETEKLLAFIKRKKELDGLSGTSVKKDSKIEALPKGRRVSKKGWKNQYGESEGGRVYYENRDNRTDRLAPNFSDKIYLAGGGYANKGVYVETLDEKIDLSDDAKVKARKTQQGSNKSYSELREKHGGSPEALAFANGGYVVIAKSEKGGGFVMSKPTTKAKAEKLKSLLPKINGESNEVMTIGKASKLSGLVGKEYLKYAEGGTIIGTPETPLARGLDIDYTGLVGETGGMSAGEMFAEGGSLGNHGLKQGDQIIKTMSGGVQKVKNKSGDIVYVNLANGYRGAEPPLPFSDGGSVKRNLSRDRKFKNYSEKHEFNYSKNKPHRRGYGYEEGGFMTDPNFGDFQSGVYATGGGVGKKKTQKELRNEYLEKLGSKEADVWDKIGAESGSQIRNSDKMLKAYAEGVEEMLQKEGVGKGSFDQEDYDFYTDENWHLFNEFLVWNGYYEPEMTKTEKAWREDRFKDPKYRNYVSNPSVITIKRVKDEDRIELGYGFDIIVEKHSYTNGKSTYGAVLYYANKLFKFFAIMPNSSKKEAINNVYDYIKTLKVSDKISENSPKKGDYSVYYNDRGGEHRKTFDTKFDAQEFINMVNYLTENSKSKSGKYIVKADIKEVKVKTDAGYEYTFKGSDVLNGVNILEKGSLLKNNATYVAKRNIMYVELKNGERIKPANGYWIKKDAKGELFKPEKKEEYKVMSNQAIFPKRGAGTYWYVENSKGQTINNTTGKPYKGKEMTNYYFLNEEEAKKFAKKLNNSSFEGGGKTTFKEKATAIAKKFEGKKVEPKYQKEYGKTYDKAEAKEVGNKIAGSQKAKYDSKIITKKGFASNDYDVIVKLPNGLTTKKDFEGFSKEEVIEWCENRGWKYNNKAEKQGGYILKDYEFFVKRPTLYNTVLPNSKGKTSKGGSTKRGGAMQLAKQIRKDGESWQSALKRANEQIRNQK